MWQIFHTFYASPLAELLPLLGPLVVVAFQGRRNATEEQKSYLRGKRYKAEKKSQGGDRKSEKSKGQSDPLISTSAKLAKEFGTSPATIKRDAKFAAAVDTLAKHGGDGEAGWRSRRENGVAR